MVRLKMSFLTVFLGWEDRYSSLMFHSVTAVSLLKLPRLNQQGLCLPRSNLKCRNRKGTVLWGGIWSVGDRTCLPVAAGWTKAFWTVPPYEVPALLFPFSKLFKLILFCIVSHDHWNIPGVRTKSIENKWAYVALGSLRKAKKPFQWILCDSPEK